LAWGDTSQERQDQMSVQILRIGEAIPHHMEHISEPEGDDQLEGKIDDDGQEDIAQPEIRWILYQIDGISPDDIDNKYQNGQYKQEIVLPSSTSILLAHPDCA
jgi:hypothetical protein